jgi:hypothetical protein
VEEETEEERELGGKEHRHREEGEEVDKGPHHMKELE